MKFFYLIFIFTIFITTSLLSYSLQLTTGSVLLSSDYFESGRLISLKYQHSLNILNLKPLYNFSLIQANGKYRSDLYLKSFMFGAGFRGNIFSPTPRSAVNISLGPSISYTTVSTEHSAEHSYITWISSSMGFKFGLFDVVNLLTEIGADYSLDKSNTLNFSISAGLEFKRGN